MSYSVSEAIDDTSARLKALKHVSKKWPEARIVNYDNINLWVVDIDLKKCTNISVVNDAIIIFKNVAPGINIAPKKHVITTEMFLVYLKQDEKSFDKIKEIFEKHSYLY